MFLFMRMSHRNDSALVTARRPNERNAFTVQEAPDSVTNFTLVLAIILNRKMLFGENMYGISKVETPFHQNFSPFNPIKYYLHSQPLRFCTNANGASAGCLEAEL